MKADYLSREQVREVDRRALSEFGLSGLVLMENAGRGCVDALTRLGVQGPVAICCGGGNNAGDGFVMARHLDLREHRAKVLLCCDPGRLTGDAEANHHILSRCQIPLIRCDGSDGAERLASELDGVDWIVDALLGTGARGEPRKPLSQIIERLNAAPARRLAVDLPSGLDCDTGVPARHTFRADHTCTFVARKPGFRNTAAHPYLGEVQVLDIGAPRLLIQEIARETT